MIHGYNLHQMQGNQIYGFRKSGYLLKKSEGKMRVKAWRKRRCEIKDGSLFIYHSDETQSPTKLNLLTCQVKLVPGKEKKCFDLISFNRTYHFQVEDEHDITAWVYVLINCKEGALKKQFDDTNNTTTNQTSNNNYDNAATDCVDFSHTHNMTGEDATLDRFGAERRVQQQLIRQVQALEGNDRCVDCSTTKDKPTWLSTNLGVLVCIECSGIHRDLGVHISRIQSLTLDNINTSQLLIAHNMGNEFFNSIYESKLRQLEILAADIVATNFDTPKLKPNSTMEQRCEFIKAKYIQKKFCSNHHRSDKDRSHCLKDAVVTKDLRKLVQLLGEGFDIASCLPLDDPSLDTQQNLIKLQQIHDCSNDDIIFPNNHCNHQPQSIAFYDTNEGIHQTTNATNTNDLSMSNKAVNNQSSLDDSIDVSNYFSSLKPTVTEGDTSIHLALKSQACYADASIQFECDLYILDFIIQNSNRTSINAKNSLGETALHYAAKYTLPECMKLLLRSGADKELTNNAGESPLDIVLNLKLPGFKALVGILGGSESPKLSLADASLKIGYSNGDSSVLQKVEQPVPHPRLKSPNMKDQNGRKTPKIHDQEQQDPSHSNLRLQIKAEALYSCVPDNPDELGFEKGETIVIMSEQTEDPDWWHGYVDGQPEKSGIFPAIFVKILHQ